MAKTKEQRAADARAYRAKYPERSRAADARWRARHPGATRQRYLRATYGLTLDAFRAMLASQGGRCAICETNTPNSHGWCVDHDHNTGKVRSILCHSCNSGIGALKDDVKLVARAAEYLRRHSDGS